MKQQESIAIIRRLIALAVADGDAEAVDYLDYLWDSITHPKGE